MVDYQTYTFLERL